MKNLQTSDETNSKRVQISTGLYKDLQRICAAYGIRQTQFIETTLRLAMARYVVDLDQRPTVKFKRLKYRRTG